MTPDIVAQGIALFFLRVFEAWLVIATIVGVGWWMLGKWSDASMRRNAEAHARQCEERNRQTKIKEIDRSIISCAKRNDWAYMLDLFESKFKLGERTDYDVDAYQKLLKKVYGEKLPPFIKPHHGPSDGHKTRAIQRG